MDLAELVSEIESLTRATWQRIQAATHQRHSTALAGGRNGTLLTRTRKTNVRLGPDALGGSMRSRAHVRMSQAPREAASHHA